MILTNMPNKELIHFVKEARKRGFSDLKIRKPLLENGWPMAEIESAFSYLNAKEKLKLKNQVTLFLNDGLLESLDKRAKKNMFTVSEQIEDILRRSSVNTKKTSPKEEKLDDLLVSCFSRRNTGKKSKK